MRQFVFYLFILIILLWLSGCAGASPTLMPTPTLAQSVPAQTLAFSPTPVPTQTARPTVTPTTTETPLPTSTFLPTPDPALSEVELLGLAWYENYDLLLSFQFPVPVDPANYRVTLAEKEYTCEVIAGFPDRLYCRGQGAKVLAAAWVRIYADGSQQPGFEKQVWVPYFDNNYSSYYH